MTIRPRDQLYSDREIKQTERDLQRSEMRIDGEDMNKFEGGEDIGRGEDTLRHQSRIPSIPHFPETEEDID